MAGTYVNTAYLYYGNPVVQKSSSISTIVANGSDLKIEKKQTPTIVPSVSTPITYTLTVANNGPLTATNIVVTETLSPLLMIWIPVIPSGQTFVMYLAILDCGVSHTAAQFATSLVLRAQPTAGSIGQTISNKADVFTPDVQDWNTSNNSASTSFIVGGLEITKTVINAVEPVQVGKEFTYHLFIVNKGGDSTSVVVRDVLTTGLSYVRSNPSGSYNPSNNTFTYNKGSVPTGGSFSVDLTVKGNNQITQTRIVSNTASINWYPDQKIKSNTIGVRLKPGADLSIAKTNGFTTVTPNQLITYTITISNTGSLATDSNRSIEITETPGLNLTYVKLIKGSLSVTTPVQTGSSWRWDIYNKSISPGAAITFQVVGKVNSAALNEENVNNQISASTYDVEGNFVSSTATKSNVVEITPTTDFKVNKSVTPEQAQVGDNFTFQIELHNSGTTTASNIRVNDYFPKALDLVSATTSRGTALLNTTTREVEVNIPTMNEGERTTIVITARVNSTVTSAKNYNNTAYIKWTGQPNYAGDTVTFRVLPSGTLPGTGAAGLSGTAGLSAAAGELPQVLSILSAVLVLIGLALLGYYLWSRRSKPLSARRFGQAAAVLIALGLVMGIGSMALGLESQPEALSMLAGEKPAVATSPPILPASPNPPTEAARTDEEPPTPESSETGELLDLRPTPDPAMLTEGTLPTPTLTNGETDISHLLPTATPSVLPDYPVPTPPALTSVGLDGAEPDASAVTRLVIPAMSLDAVVKYVPYSGSTWLISGLKQEIAWMGDTSWPGLGGNTGLAGHVDLVTGERGPFWNLRNLKSGDEVRVYTAKRIYVYRVSEQKTVDDTDMSVLAETSKPRLTLITCTGWDANVRIYLKRLVVFADLIRTQTLAASAD